MKYLLTILLSSILFAACSSSKMITMDPVHFDPCTEQADLVSGDVYTGETVDNLVIDQQSGIVFVNMDVRTYCNSDLSLNMKQKENQIIMMLTNSNTEADDCVCTKKARTSLRDLASGTYDLRITDNTGYKLLEQKDVIIP